MPSPLTRQSRALAPAIALLLGIFPLCAQQADPASAQKPATQPKPSQSPATDPGASTLKATRHATATPIDVEKAELGEEPLWNPKWDLIVENALPASMLSSKVPRDVRRFCPRFYRMSRTNKLAFWAYFFQALAGAEAGLNPTSRVRHVGALIPRDPVTGHPVHCEGLLQLSYQDSQRYGCNFDWEVDRKLPANDPELTILQPKNNLECGVKILTRQIIDSHKPIFWKLSYWATLRPGTESYRIFARQMTSPPRACGFPSRRHRILDGILFMRNLIARNR